MIKRILFVFTLVLISNYSFSQVNFGIRTGLNISDYTKMDSYEKYGFYIGGYTSIPFTEKYTLQPEISFTNQGSHLKSVLEGQPNNITNDYLSFSVINKFKFKKNLSLIIGPYLDIRVNKNIEINKTVIYWSYSTLILSSVDIGGEIGISYKVMGNFMIEARYKTGFVDAIQEDYFYNSDTRNTNLTQVIQIGIAYNLNLN